MLLVCLPKLLIPQITVVALKISRRVPRDISLHVGPDIVLFKGRYERREELAVSKPSALIIDAKLEVKEKDLEQLISYNKVFSNHLEKCHFMVVSLRGIPHYLQRKLDQIGWRVVDDVKPGSNGLTRFKEAVQSNTSSVRVFPCARAY